jgi:hypothetical protein
MAKIAEVQSQVIRDVKKTEILRNVMRINFGSETTNKVEFKLTDDLKRGDKVKITFEKI